MIKFRDAGTLVLRIQTSSFSILQTKNMHLQLLRNLPYVQQIHVLYNLQSVVEKTGASFHAFGLK